MPEEVDEDDEAEVSDLYFQDLLHKHDEANASCAGTHYSSLHARVCGCLLC
jgi:hypothetical protein